MFRRMLHYTMFHIVVQHDIKLLRSTTRIYLLKDFSPIFPVRFSCGTVYFF